jgi:hypothetical protein
MSSVNKMIKSVALVFEFIYYFQVFSLGPPNSSQINSADIIISHGLRLVFNLIYQLLLKF